MWIRRMPLEPDQEPQLSKKKKKKGVDRNQKQEEKREKKKGTKAIKFALTKGKKKTKTAAAWIRNTYQNNKREESPSPRNRLPSSPLPPGFGQRRKREMDGVDKGGER